MESWVIIAAHLLLQLVHSITGAALEGVRLSVTPTTPPTPTPSQAAPYWMRPVPPDPPTDTSGGARGGTGTEGPGATHTPAPPDTTRGLQETQGPGGATHTVFPQLLPQETLAPPASSSPTSATQTRDAAAGQVPGSATVNQVTPGPAAAGTGAPQGAEPGDSSSSRKTQVTSLPGSSSGPPPPLPPRPPSRSPDHSAAIKASSGSPVTPLTPHTPSPTGSPPPNWANGRLGTSTGNPGHSAHPLPPALPPPSPIDTSQTDRAQLARIWSAGEDDQWAGGGRRGGLRQRPPWAWTKGRRRRRKLPGEPAPPLPDLPPVPVPRRAPAQTPSLPGRVESSSHDSIGGGSDARVPTSAVQAAPQLDGGDGAGRYEVLRPGGGHIDFKVTETGEFDGFSVTRTEEVDDAPPDPHQANTSWAGVTRGEAASDRHDSPSDGGIAASGREKLPGESDRSPEGTPLPEDRTNDAPGEISLSTTSSQGEDDRAAPSSPLPTLEDIYSRELSQMKQEVQAPQYGLARPRAEAAGAEATTLPSLYNGDLIPPLPDHWERPWSGVGRLGDFSGAVNTPAPAPEVNQPLATFPAQVQTEVPGEGTPWNVEGSTGHPATAPPLPQAAAPHTSREDENDGAWQTRHLTEHNVSTAGTAATPGPVPPPPSGPQHEARRAADMKHGGGAATHNSQATQPSPRGREGAGASWPGAGERVEFVTVVPGGNWDVWGGPAIWDSISSTSNHSLRGSPVYSVYWGDTGGPGSPAGWPEGVWVIRGGSLAAIMALVATISVQVARDGPARRASVAEGPTRVLHGQHATLATNLATSLASAHVLLIFGIQATGRAWVCGVVGLLLHFLHLVSCFWLLALTTRLLGSLLQRPAMHTAFYCASAWGASLGLVVVSYVVNPEGYETRRYCWMSVERGMLVSFIVPVCSLILVNAGLCLAAQKLLLDMREGVKHEVMAVHKRDLRGAVCLLPLEGVSWFLAVVALEDHQSLALDCAAALVSACLGWLILYFHGWSWRCHGLCWLRHRLHSSSTSSTSSNSSRRMEDLSLPLTARYDHDLAHQPLLHPLPPPPPPPLPAQGTVTVTPAPCPPTAVTPPPPARPEEFPLQPIFPGHERREVY